MEKLRECGHCGGKARRAYQGIHCRDDYKVYCCNPNCGMTTPWEGWQERADQIWNRRTFPEDAIREAARDIDATYMRRKGWRAGVETIIRRHLEG